MKKILCAALILFVYAAVSAQEKTIDQKQFNAMYQNGCENWKGKPYRLTITTLSSFEGRPQTDYSSKAVFEFASPTINRSVLEANFQSVSKKTEILRIGDKTYVRNGSAAWQEKALPENILPFENKAADAENKANNRIEYKYLGTETLNDQTANVYERIKKENKINSKTGQEELSTSVIKYWFAADGLILKSEMQAESRDGEAIYRTRLTQIWESDPKIKIEAPNLN